MFNKWYLVEKNSEFFAEKQTKLPSSDRNVKILFRDYNNEVMSLGRDKEWAKEWIDSKNIIDNLL